MNNLYSGFCEVCLHSDLLSGVDVRVMCLSKRLLELLELAAGERGPDAALFALLRADGCVIDVI